MVAPSQALNPEKKEHLVDTDVELQVSEEKKALAEQSDEDYLASPYNDTVIARTRVQQPPRRAINHKRRLWLQLLLFCGMIVGLTLCVIGSIRLYRGMYMVTRFEGRCGVGLIDMSRYNVSSDRSYSYEAQTYIYEDVEIEDSVETLKVPSVGNSSAATIRHDFGKNFTGIRDELKHICFFVPFLTEFTNGAIPQPSVFSDLIKDKFFEDDIPTVYQIQARFTYQTDSTDEGMEGLADIGSALSELCEGVPSYRATPQPADVGTPPPPTGDLPTTSSMFEEFFFPEDQYYTMYPGGDAALTYILSHSSF